MINIIIKIKNKILIYNKIIINKIIKAIKKLMNQ